MLVPLSVLAVFILVELSSSSSNISLLEDSRLGLRYRLITGFWGRPGEEFREWLLK